MPPDLSPADPTALQVLAAARRFSSPGYLTGQENLQISSWNSLAGVTLTIVGRVLRVDGTIYAFRERQVPNTDRTIATTIYRLAEGWLLNLSVFVGAGAPIIGQTFVRASLVQGQFGGTENLGTLAAHYVTAVQPLAWPGSPVRSTLDGPGALRSIGGTNPAAGVDVAETVPTGARWRLMSLHVRFVTNATVANRLPLFILDDAVTTFWQSDPPAAQTASGNFGWSVGLSSARLAVAHDTNQWALPSDIRLLSGHRMRTQTTNIQAGDDWGAPQLLIEEWLEGAA